MCTPEQLQQKKGETEMEDNESLEEKCWEEQYKGASRKWLIRDASAKMPQDPLCSTMKESYLYPEKENSLERSMGKRKTFLMKKFYEEASAEVIKERETEEEPDSYCTEYDGNYNAEGFKPDDKFYRKNTELFQKYPLYSSAPVSYYSHTRQINPQTNLTGITKITDKQNIFRRNGQFSKPIAESFDYVEL